MNLSHYEYVYEIQLPNPAIISEEISHENVKYLLKNMIAVYSEMTERELAKPVTKRDMLGLMWLIDQLHKDK